MGRMPGAAKAGATRPAGVHLLCLPALPVPSPRATHREVTVPPSTRNRRVENGQITTTSLSPTLLHPHYHCVRSDVADRRGSALLIPRAATLAGASATQRPKTRRCDDRLSLSPENLLNQAKPPPTPSPFPIPRLARRRLAVSSGSTSPPAAHYSCRALHHRPAASNANA